MGGTVELLTIPKLLCLGAPVPSQVTGRYSSFTLGSSQFSSLEGRLKTPGSAPRPTTTRLPSPLSVPTGLRPLKAGENHLAHFKHESARSFAWLQLGQAETLATEVAQEPPPLSLPNKAHRQSLPSGCLLPCCLAAVPPRCPDTCPVAPLLCCRAATLPCCPAAGPAVVLPCCPAAPLPCCRAAPLPC